MEKTLISWNIENLITIWLMLFIGFLVLAVAIQLFGKWSPKSSVASTSGGY